MISVTAKSPHSTVPVSNVTAASEPHGPSTTHSVYGGGRRTAKAVKATAPAAKPRNNPAATAWTTA